MYILLAILYLLIIYYAACIMAIRDRLDVIKYSRSYNPRRRSAMVSSTQKQLIWSIVRISVVLVCFVAVVALELLN